MNEKTGYNYSKLKGRMREKDITQEVLAKELGVAISTFHLKISNKAEFKQSEILGICKALEIKPEEIVLYFFTI